MKVPLFRTIVFVTAVFCGWIRVPAHPVLDEAKRLALAGAAEEAVTEYKRYLFFNPDSPAVAVYLSIAGLYRDRDRLEDAQDALKSALAAAGCDSLRDAVRIESSIIALAQGKYQPAQMELLRVASYSGTAALRNRAGFFLCVAYILDGEWEAAKRTGIAGAAVSGPGGGQLRQLDSLLKPVLKYSRKSPVAAKWMSTVLPGLGQVYAHDLPGGLNALAISAITGFMTVHSIVYGYYQEAVFTDITLFWRYYSGNRWHASGAAERYNGKWDRAIRKRIMEVLSRKE